MPGNVSKGIIPPQMVEFRYREYIFRVNGNIDPDDNPISKQSWTVVDGKVIIEDMLATNKAVPEVQIAYQEALVNLAITSE